MVYAIEDFFSRRNHNQLLHEPCALGFWFRQPPPVVRDSANRRRNLLDSASQVNHATRVRPSILTKDQTETRDTAHNIRQKNTIPIQEHPNVDKWGHNLLDKAAKQQKGNATAAMPKTATRQHEFITKPRRNT